MNQKSSLRKILQFVSQALTANTLPRLLQNKRLLGVRKLRSFHRLPLLPAWESGRKTLAKNGPVLRSQTNRLEGQVAGIVDKLCCCGFLTVSANPISLGSNWCLLVHLGYGAKNNNSCGSSDHSFDVTVSKHWQVGTFSAAILHSSVEQAFWQ
jgi:hypothetical protein